MAIFFSRLVCTGLRRVQVTTALSYLSKLSQGRLDVPRSCWLRSSNRTLRGIVTKAMHTEAAQTSQAFPITANFLTAAHAFLTDGRGSFSFLEDHIYWTALAFAYFFQLRACEYCGKHAILLQNAVLLVSGKRHAAHNYWRTESAKRASVVAVQVNSSKTDKCCQSVTLTLHRSGHPFLCPVRVVADAIALHAKTLSLSKGADSAKTSARLFPSVTYNRLEKYLAGLARRLGLANRKVTSQGLRRGATSVLFAHRVSAEDIRRLGRWAKDSDAVYRYRDPTVEGSAAYSRLLARPVSIL